MELDHERLRLRDSSTAAQHKKGSEKDPAYRAFQDAEIQASQEASISRKTLEQFARTTCPVREPDCDYQHTPPVRSPHEQGPATIRLCNFPLRTGYTSGHQTLHAFSAASI